MADNIDVTPGTGKTVAADDVGGFLYQRIKNNWGPDGTANEVDIASGKPMPVQIRSATGLIPLGEPTDAKSTATDSTSITAMQVWKQVSASVQSLVSGITALGATTMTASLPVTIATDDARIGIVTETAPATDTASSGLNGRLQRIAQRLTSLIAVHPAALGGTTAANSFPVVLSSDGPFASQTGSVTETAPATDTASSGLNGRLQRIAQRISSLIVLLPPALGAGGGLKVDGSGTALPVSGTVTANATLAAETTKVIGTVNVAAAQSIAAVAAGDVANAASDSGNPVKIGGIGKTASPTAVTDGQRVNAWFSKTGKQVVVGAIRELLGTQQTSISASTSETTIVTAVASTFLDLYGLILANTGASTTKVSIRDATAGTVKAVIEVPTLETRGFMLPVDSAMGQATVNNNWTAQCGTSTTALEVTALFVKNT